MSFPVPLACSTCSKTFSRKGDLTRHTLLHTGIKPYACSACGKSFSQYSGLKTHRNVHTKAKPYECGADGCKAAFGDPSSCTRHRKEIHRSISGYRCPFPRCKSSIKRRSAFTSHLKKHNIDPNTVDINAMAPPLLPKVISRRKSLNTLNIPRPPDYKYFDNILTKFVQNNHIPYTYDVHQSTIPPYFAGFTGNNVNYYPNNALFPLYPPQHDTTPSFPIPQIRTEELYSIDSPFTPPDLDFSLSPSPCPSRNDLVRTPSIVDRGMPMRDSRAASMPPFVPESLLSSHRRTPPLLFPDLAEKHVYLEYQASDLGNMPENGIHVR